jgi:hypothetical protein
MDEHQGAGHAPETLAELAGQAGPATPAAATAAKKGRTSTPQQLLAQANSQLEALKQTEYIKQLQSAETIKQLQNQVRGLEKQSRDAGKVFLGTTTTLMNSAFALVAALAWNDAVQGLFDYFFNTQGTLTGSIGKVIYAVFITIIVVLVIYYLTRLNRRVGGRSLLDEVPHGEGGRREESKAEGGRAEGGAAQGGAVEGGAAEGSWTHRGKKGGD